jgi:sporulation protein YlmC with PRC-barrel domain
MEFHFGADVRLRDGDEVGSLRRLVFDPGTAQVVSLVVEHNAFDEREVLVPIGAVNDSDTDATYLEVSREQFDGMPDFMIERNVAPPPDSANVTSDLIKEPIDVPDVPPVGAATGVESIAFTPVLQESMRVPRDDEIIDSDMEIWASDVELGRVRNLVVDEQTHRISIFVLREGFIFTHDVDIPMDWVDHIRPESIVLKVDKATVEAGSAD